jgi:uracil-DNA glycosylase family 4
LLTEELKDRNPEKDDILNCLHHLKEEIKILKPKVIVSLGNVPTKFLAETSQGITRMCGKKFEYDGITVIPLFHPAYLLMDGGDKEKELALNALEVIKDALN